MNLDTTDNSCSDLLKFFLHLGQTKVNFNEINHLNL
jgi:hypothetical protein